MNQLRTYSPTHKLAISGIAIALYIVVMAAFGSFAFLQHQVRLATSLYSLSALFPFLIVPLGLGNMLSNLLLGGLGPLDALGGFTAGVITSALVYLLSKIRFGDYLAALPIILVPGLLVPVWLSYLIDVPYLILAADLLAGQVIPGILGVLIIKTLRRVKYFKPF